MEVQPCRKCAEPVSTDADVCPHCGFDPSEVRQWRRRVFNVLGWLCTVSIVGAPLGLLFFGLAWWQKRVQPDLTRDGQLS